MWPLRQLFLLLVLLPPTSGNWAARYRMWDVSGTPVVVVPYSFGIPPAATVPVTATLTIQQRDSSDVVHGDTATHITSTGSDAHGEPRWSGMLLLSTPTPLATWSLAAVTERAATATLISSGSQRPLELAPLVLSDLIVGSDSASVRWTHGGTTTLVGLSNTFGKRHAVQVSFQALSSIAREHIRTTITVTDVTNIAQGHRVMSAATDGTLRAGVNEFEREIRVTNLRSGHYLVELQLGDLVNGGASVRSIAFTVR